MARINRNSDREEKKSEKSVSSRTLPELREHIANLIEASEWHGKTGEHIKKILTMPIDELRKRRAACKGKGGNALYEMLGVMRNGAVVMPEGYTGIIGVAAVDVRLEELARIDYTAEKQYGDYPEAKQLAESKTIHD